MFGTALWFLSPKIDMVIPGLNLFSYFFGSFFVVIVLQLAAGVGLGACASWLAIRKYLKV